MVKICQKCGMTNDDKSFWCNKCGISLIKNSSQEEDKTNENKEEKQTIQVEEYDYSQPYDDTLKKRYNFFLKFKKPITGIIIILIVISSFFIIYNMRGYDFDWDRFGGSPWDQDFLPWNNSNFPWIKGLNMNNVYNSWENSYYFKDIGEIGSDYWFEGNTIITNSGWTFNLTKVENCSYKGKILDYYVYNKDCPIYQPSELFSPVDIFLGFDDIIVHPEKYPYKVESYFYRGVYVRCTGSSDAEDYFLTHVTNTHLIPYTQEISNKLKTINIGDIVTINGTYVDVYGRHGNNDNTYSWSTDTNIGDSNSEIILIDSITFS
jgi:hypothetical protein